MQICNDACMHLYVYLHIYIYICIHLYLCMPACIRICVLVSYTQICNCTCIRTCTCIYIYMHMHIFIHRSIYACIYMYIYIYIQIHLHKVHSMDDVSFKKACVIPQMGGTKLALYSHTILPDCPTRVSSGSRTPSTKRHLYYVHIMYVV